MFRLRSARAQVAAAVLLFVLLLVTISAVAAWSARNHQSRLQTLEQTSLAAASLQHARAEFLVQIALLGGVGLSAEPSLVELYREAGVALEQDIARARGLLLAEGEADDVARLDAADAHIAEIEEIAQLGFALVEAGDAEGLMAMTRVAQATLWDPINEVMASLEDLAGHQEERLVSERAATAHAAQMTLWSLIGLGSAAFLLAVGGAVAVTASVVRPLASLRAKARAIAAGGLQVKAEVSGPEEVASLARDFNEMTDALSARTEEYIATTNLTGDIIAKWDQYGRWVFLNDAACQFFGRPREELLGTESIASVHPEDIDSTVQAVHEARARKELVRGFVNRCGTPMGTRVVEWNGYPLFDEEGQYAGIQITGRDITERRQAEEELRLHREHLEDLVGVRTAELRRANEDLQQEISERRRVGEALRESEGRYRLLAENASDLIWTMDLSLRYTYMSPSVTRMRGYSAEEIVGTTVQETMTPASLELARKTLAEELAIERMEHKDLLRSRTLELEMNCKDGSTIWTEVKMTGIRDPDGKLVGILGVTRDISERKKAEEELKALNESLEERVAERTAVAEDRAEALARANVELAAEAAERRRVEQALRESEGRYRLLAENTSDLIWTMDLSLRYTYMSPSVTRMRGYSAEEIVGATVQETLTPDSLELARKTLAEELAIERMEHKDLSRSRKLELEMYCKGGFTIWTEVNMTFLRDPDGKPVGIMGVTRDISDRKRAEEERERLNAELELRAITDGLTGLYDHAHFYQRLAEETDRSKRYRRGFAVLMMDVDNFKWYNDSHGHQAGDEALCLIGECIQKAMRRSDLAFRYGGDEFAAILPHADSSKARAVVDRINGHISKNLKEMDDSAGARLSLSAGVACFPDDGTTTDDLVRTADGALYSAKWLARARDIMKQQADIESLLSASAKHRVGAQAPEGKAMPLPDALQEQRTAILSSVAGSLGLALRDAGVTEAHEDPDLQVVSVVGAAAEMKDRYIRGHPERTSEQAVTLAEQMGLSSEQVRDIRIAGLLHDIGKISVSESILNKPSRLTRSEFAMIKDHPIVGATLVSQVKGFGPLAPIIRHHHERFDGTGYPDGLAGEDIPLEARILAVADVFDAITHQRAYRKALSKGEAVAELKRGAGTQYDPAVVEAFLALVKERGKELAAPAQTPSEGKRVAAARAPASSKG